MERFIRASRESLQPPARLHPVEIAVNVKLEHRRRMIRRPAGRCWINAIEPELAQFQRIHEHIDRANRIALVDPIIEAFRQQRRLPAIRPLNETLHHFPRRFSKRIIASTEFSHSLGHSRPNWAVPAMSGLPPIATKLRTSRDVSNVPEADLTCPVTSPA